MKSYLHGSAFIRPFYPGLIWKRETDEKKVFLTFDDGPHPEVTPFVLDTLDRFNFKATFFCIGNNVQLHPNTYKQVIDRGHSTGNHTFNHTNGFKTSLRNYVNEARLAAEHIDSQLFRPPYGKIRRDQLIRIKKMGYDIIMWSILSGDFDPKLNHKKALNEVTQRTQPGSIIVFHDSLKARKNLEVLLPQYCAYLTENGYTSCSL